MLNKPFDGCGVGIRRYIFKCPITLLLFCNKISILQAMDGEPIDLQPLEDVESFINQFQVFEKIDDLLPRKRKRCELIANFYCSSFFFLLFELESERIDTIENNKF